MRIRGVGITQLRQLGKVGRVRRERQGGTHDRRGGR